MREASAQTSSGTRSTSLRDQLSDYAGQHGAQVATVQRMLKLLDAADGQPFSRDQFVPGHFTASAFVLDPSCQRLLLLHHRKLKLWLQPGGHVEPEDPTLEAAARRELCEETGLASAELHTPGIFDIDIHAIPAGRDPQHEHFDVRFLFRAPQLSFGAAADPHHVRWVPLGDVCEAGSDGSVTRALAKIQRLLAQPA